MEIPSFGLVAIQSKGAHAFFLTQQSTAVPKVFVGYYSAAYWRNTVQELHSVQLLASHDRRPPSHSLPPGVAAATTTDESDDSLYESCGYGVSNFTINGTTLDLLFNKMRPTRVTKFQALWASWPWNMQPGSNNTWAIGCCAARQLHPQTTVGHH